MNVFYAFSGIFVLRQSKQNILGRWILIRKKVLQKLSSTMCGSCGDCCLHSCHHSISVHKCCSGLSSCTCLSCLTCKYSKSCYGKCKLRIYYIQFMKVLDNILYNPRLQMRLVSSQTCPSLTSFSPSLVLQV